ncbi:MAG TPA: UDP-glucose/GDP-mannose dehydrogenase family protein [Terriglobales bacterium]|nr:UDP-glucose/GDP-mannose dehydrogenase family protein [Terriglobales bacterium]HYL65245.1 UDP-glucose/GDP-mannose dehydrogenase family protein [Candidatus Methylomirabilis sp.]
MRISVIGCGYVGLVTGTCFAEAGHQVVCTDNDPQRIASLKAGVVPIYEPHLDAMLAENQGSHRLSFISDAVEAVRAGEAIFICVGTPPLENGEADLSAIDNVARMIATNACESKLVVEKSTVPAQTGQQLKRVLEVYRRNDGAQFRVASNPEFLREGTAVEDFLHPDRIVFGVEDEVSEKQLREIYRPILERRFRCTVHFSGCPTTQPPTVVVTTINSAELIKHASNSFLAMKISYANMIADLCEKVGGNIKEVTRALGLDPRIGPRFLDAGLGFGGFCLPKDVQAFIRLAERSGVDFSMLKEAERVNKRRIDRFFEKIRQSLWIVKDKRVGVLGLAFKSNTDDIRFAPSLDVLRRLLAEGAQVHAYDQEAMDRTSAIFPQVHFCREPYEVARDSDALLILTEWDEFRQVDWERIHSLMARPLVIDGRNMLNPVAMKEYGFEYYCFGRPEETATVQFMLAPVSSVSGLSASA